MAAGEAHDLCGVIGDVAGQFVLPNSADALSSFDEVDLIIELIVGKPGELLTQDNGQAMVRDVG
jgi:hypothetical protein